jgi:hypothetical protein
LARLSTTGSLVAALAQPAPAAPSGTNTPTRRSGGAARRRATARRRVAIAAVAAIAVGAAALLLRGGDDPISRVRQIISDEPTVEPFAFDNVRTTVSPLSTTKPKRLRDVAAGAGGQIAPVIEELIMQTYVDPDAWGDYGDAWDLFEGGAAEQAEADADVLTLGASADGLYDELRADGGALRVIVLTDAKDRPIRAVAQVRFFASASLKDGSATEITTEGSYFLLRDGDEWRIVAYDVERREDPAGSTTGATGTTGTTGTATGGTGAI